MFNLLTGYARPQRYRSVLVAPDYLRDGIIERDRRDDRRAARPATRRAHRA